MTTSMFRRSLVEKQALVTGATGSIGFAIAMRLAREGANVVLLGRNNVKLNAAFERARGELGPAPQDTTTLTTAGRVEKQLHDVTRMDDWVAVKDKFVLFPPSLQPPLLI